MKLNKLPSNIYEILSDENIWWEHAQKSTMGQFLSQYTLHDSYWISVDFQQNGLCNVIIEFDLAYINFIRKNSGLSIIGNSINQVFYLLITFDNVHQILSDHSEKYVIDYVINHASTRRLSIEQRTLWLDAQIKLDIISKETSEFLLNENVHITTFEGTANNNVYLVHNEPTFFLAVESTGSPVKLPDLNIEDLTE